MRRLHMIKYPPVVTSANHDSIHNATLLTLDLVDRISCSDKSDDKLAVRRVQKLLLLLGYAS